MLLTGTNLTQPNDRLQKVTIDYLIDMIKNPQHDIESTIRQLRGVYQLNPKQYNLLKRQLPYFVCGIFNPPFRKKENFGYTEYFILDIDKLQSKGLDIDIVRKDIVTDPQVLACFKSPSEDGLKVVFRLDQRCYDSGVYTTFYRSFLRYFSSLRNLNQVVDTVTCDVSRACFFTFDRDIYYNPNALKVSISAYIDLDKPNDFFEEISETYNEKEQDSTQSKGNESANSEPPSDIMAQIKQRLNPKPTLQRIEPESPQILNDIIDGIKSYIESFGINVTDIRNIQFGKKIHCALGIKQAELNIFYGKRGFSYVVSPKSGTSTELNDMVKQIVEEYVNSL